MCFLGVAFLSQDRLCEHTGFGHNQWHQASELQRSTSDIKTDNNSASVKASIFENMGTSELSLNPTDPKILLLSTSTASQATQKAQEISWDVLMDIDYTLQYYEEFNMEIYAPVFTEEVKKLHKKEVVIEGHIIPLDVEQEIVALSYNPYASCFFCGQASPASVISMHLKSKGKRYKKDTFKKFQGTLYLNQDDPNEFYYILKNAREYKNEF